MSYGMLVVPDVQTVAQGTPPVLPDATGHYNLQQYYDTQDKANRGPFCFGIDNSICYAVQGVKFGPFDLEPPCIVITNLICLLLGVVVLALLLGVGLAALFQ